MKTECTVTGYVACLTGAERVLHICRHFHVCVYIHMILYIYICMCRAM